MEYFKSLSDFDFAIGAILNLLFEYWWFGKGGSSKHDKMREVKD
jgi:hypothetical protein